MEYGVSTGGEAITEGWHFIQICMDLHSSYSNTPQYVLKVYYSNFSPKYGKFHNLLSFKTFLYFVGLNGYTMCKPGQPKYNLI